MSTGTLSPLRWLEATATAPSTSTSGWFATYSIARSPRPVPPDPQSSNMTRTGSCLACRMSSTNCSPVRGVGLPAEAEMALPPTCLATSSTASRATRSPSVIRITFRFTALPPRDVKKDPLKQRARHFSENHGHQQMQDGVPHPHPLRQDGQHIEDLRQRRRQQADEASRKQAQGGGPPAGQVTGPIKKVRPGGDDGPGDERMLVQVDLPSGPGHLRQAGNDVQHRDEGHKTASHRQSPGQSDEGRHNPLQDHGPSGGFLDFS